MWLLDKDQWAGTRDHRVLQNLEQFVEITRVSIEDRRHPRYWIVGRFREDSSHLILFKAVEQEHRDAILDLIIWTMIHEPDRKLLEVSVDELSTAGTCLSGRLTNGSSIKREPPPGRAAALSLRPATLSRRHPKSPRRPPGERWCHSAC